MLARRMAAALTLLLLASGRPASAGLERVAPAALDAFRRAPGGRVPLLVHWAGAEALPVPYLGETRRETRRRVVAALRERGVFGAQLCARLSRTCRGLSSQPLWIANAAAVSADRQALLLLAHQPGVRAVLAPPRFRLLREPPLAAALALNAPLLSLLAAPAEPPPPWHITRMHVPEVWAQGITGQGVVVATVDTGADRSHPALRARYRGAVSGGDERNWFDAVSGRAAPFDDHGHGTHALGTMVGDGGPGNRIGVAPGATWIAARAADGSGELDVVNVLRAMQWLLAPTDRNGAHPDPDQAPDVVSSSWGDYPGTDETLRDAVRAWAAAGIVPVFAAGNNGIFGMGSPASYPEAIAVGATDGRDTVASFSSRGPSPIDEAVKPDLVAPGVLIRSAVPGGGYFPYSGTSFSTPGVAGIAALLLQANSSLTPAAIAGVLRATADPILPAPLPNNDAGWGRVNALAAVNAVRSRPER